MCSSVALSGKVYCFTFYQGSAQSMGKAWAGGYPIDSNTRWFRVGYVIHIMYQWTNKSLLFQLEIPRGRGHLAKMPEQGSCSAGFPTTPNLHTCLEFGWWSFKSLFIRSSPFITHRASKSCRSPGFGRFLAFSPLVTRIPHALYFLCAFRRDLRVLWA